MITEIAFYLPDTPGQFARCLQVLASADVNIHGFSVDLGGAISLVRMVCSDPERAKNELETNGYEVEETRVFVLSLPNAPGQLLRIADLLGSKGINIKYGYCILGSGSATENEVLVIIKIEDDDKRKYKAAAAKQYFEESGLTDLDHLPEKMSEF